MLKKKKIRIIILLISIVFLFIYFLASSIIGNHKFDNLKSILNDQQKQLIKKYVFPFQVISQKQNIIDQMRNQMIERENNLLNFLADIELNIKKSGLDIELEESFIKLENNITLKKFNLASGFYRGINNTFPGSGYFDFHDDNIIIISSLGILGYKNILDDNKKKIKQIENNINEFISIKQLKQHNWFSLKDILIFNNRVFISYTDEIEENCWNTSIIFGEMNYKKIKFRKLFSPKKCIDSIKNIDKEFNAHQSGGKIVSLDNENILFSIGDYRNRHLAQNKRSINGKIIRININNSNYEIISKGHRNPQGLYFDKYNNFVLETEHGPQGGDELNIIDLHLVNKKQILNFGWPISSYGEHYGGRIEKNKKKYDKYPLYKSHIEHGFIEPVHSFVPSIGISEIVKTNDNQYVISSLKDKSLYFFELNQNKAIKNLRRVEVFERVRDLKFYNNKLFLFMEDSASIGIININ